MSGVTHDPTLPTISPSQIKTYLDCPRKWAFDKIDQIPRESSPAAAKGTACHDVTEHKIWNAVNPGSTDVPFYTEQIEKISQGIFSLYGIQEGDKVLTEHEFFLPRERWTYHGFIDLLFVRNDRLKICDHKTSRDPHKWGLTNEMLKRDEQGILYSQWGIEAFEVDEVDLIWGYGKTCGAVNPFQVNATMTREDNAKRLPVIDEVAEQIVESYQASTALDLEPNLDACNKFGGCPYLTMCPRPKQSLRSMMKGR
jgi:hypothetical protein